MKHLNETKKKEEIGWMILVEKSLQDVWNNPKDDKLWRKYLQ